MSDTAVTPSPVVVSAAEEWLSDPARFSGEWQGASRGSAVCIIANRIEAPGGGAKAHSHPYAETFVVREGRVRFTIGEETVMCDAGQIVVVPAGVVHAFSNEGPGPLEMIDIHENGAFRTFWAE